MMSTQQKIEITYKIFNTRRAQQNLLKEFENSINDYEHAFCMKAVFRNRMDCAMSIIEKFVPYLEKDHKREFDTLMKRREKAVGKSYLVCIHSDDLNVKIILEDVELETKFEFFQMFKNDVFSRFLDFCGIQRTDNIIEGYTSVLVFPE